MNSLNLTPTRIYLGAAFFFFTLLVLVRILILKQFFRGVDKFVQKIELDKKEAFGFLFFSLSTKMNKKQSFKTENISF